MIGAMPQSLSKVILHIIFSTKNRELWLDSGVRPRMHAYLATICRDLGVDFVHVGGVSDHIHVVTTLPRTVSQAEFIEQIKKRLPNGSKSLTLAIGVFSGSAGMAHFQSVPVSSRPCWNTSRGNKTTIARARFRKNTATCCADTASISTNVTCGIETLNRAFSAAF